MLDRDCQDLRLYLMGKPHRGKSWDPIIFFYLHQISRFLNIFVTHFIKHFIQYHCLLSGTFPGSKTNIIYGKNTLTIKFHKRHESRNFCPITRKNFVEKILFIELAKST